MKAKLLRFLSGWEVKFVYAVIVYSLIIKSSLPLSHFHLIYVYYEQAYILFVVAALSFIFPVDRSKERIVYLWSVFRLSLILFLGYYTSFFGLPAVVLTIPAGLIVYSVLGHPVMFTGMFESYPDTVRSVISILIACTLTALWICFVLGKIVQWKKRKRIAQNLPKPAS